MHDSLRKLTTERTYYPKAWYHPIPETDEELAGTALRFTLSQPVTLAIPPEEVPLFRLAVKIVAG